MRVYSRNQFVPVVCKDRDYLIGFLDCASNITFEDDGQMDMFLTLSSLRFHDILPNGERKRNVTPEESQQILKDYRDSMRLKENEVESEESSEVPPLLKIHCTCGNYVEFPTEMDIPKHSYKCDICSKYLIDYTASDMWEFVYDGFDTDEEDEIEDE